MHTYKDAKAMAKTLVSAQGSTCFRPAGDARGYRRNQSALMVSINRVVAFGRTV